MKSNKSLNTKNIKTRNFKIAIAQARFNSDITDKLLAGALKAFKELKIKNIKIIKTPGAFEIPLACQKLAKTKKFDGILALGAVIKGETAHFDYVCKGATNGVMRVMLDQNLPISFGVLTTDNLKQAQARSRNDKTNKGYEAALSLVEMIDLF